MRENVGENAVEWGRTGENGRVKEGEPGKESVTESFRERVGERGRMEKNNEECGRALRGKESTGRESMDRRVWEND